MDVTANPAHEDGYSSPPDSPRNFFDKRNYTKVNKRVDDQKSQLRVEKQAKNQTGAPAMARAKPTELQIMRDVAL